MIEMAGELAVRGGIALKKSAAKGALKKAAKKVPLKKVAGKKSAAKKVPGKKAAGKKAAAKKGAKRGSALGAAKKDGMQAHAFHHLQRSVALVSLLEQKSGGDLRMLLEEGIAAYRRSAWEQAAGLLRAAEHIGMAGLYAARAEHRLTVEQPDAREVEEQMDQVAVRLENLTDLGEKGSGGRLHAMAVELLDRAEAAGHDLHLAWELVQAADGICDGLNGTRE